MPGLVKVIEWKPVEFQQVWQNREFHTSGEDYEKDYAIIILVGVPFHLSLEANFLSVER